MNESRDLWKRYTIPLTGNVLWQRTKVGVISLGTIDYIEIHADTWNAGFSLWVDGLSFESFNQANPVLNSGFETDVLANEGSFIFNITDWTTTGNSGTFNPDVVSFSGGNAPEGQNVAFIAGPNSSISQVLSTTLRAKTEYTLSIDVGNRLNIGFSGYKVELFAGATLLAEDNNFLNPLPDEFLTSTITYLATSDDPLLGQPLEIRLGKVSSGQVMFDKVRLDTRLVP